jgi:hypothetical protein
VNDEQVMETIYERDEPWYYAGPTLARRDLSAVLVR